MHDYQMPLVLFTVMSQWGIGAVLALSLYQWQSDCHRLVDRQNLLIICYPCDLSSFRERYFPVRLFPS